MLALSLLSHTSTPTQHSLLTLSHLFACLLGVTREDCLALSRLYAVQLLSGLCGDFQAAADWLTGGGAGLSEEQQEVRHILRLVQSAYLAEGLLRCLHCWAHYLVWSVTLHLLGQFVMFMA
jgi:hypothetical protein